MEKKRSRKAMYSALVGVVLVTGSVVLAQDTNLRAVVINSIGEDFAFVDKVGRVNMRFFTRRAVKERDASARTVMKVKENLAKAMQESDAEMKEQEELAMCQRAQTRLTNTKVSVLRIIPSSESYASLRQKVTAAFDEEVTECGSIADASTAGTSAVSPTPRVNNDCQQYGKTTRRYAQCIVNERNNQRYQGRQTKRL